MSSMSTCKGRYQSNCSDFFAFFFAPFPLKRQDGSLPTGICLFGHRETRDILFLPSSEEVFLCHFCSASSETMEESSLSHMDVCQQDRFTREKNLRLGGFSWREVENFPRGCILQLPRLLSVDPYHFFILTKKDEKGCHRLQAYWCKNQNR